MHDEVRHALKRVASEAAAARRVLVLTGAGRGFCAGQDLSDRAVEPGAPGRSVDLGDSVEKNYAPLVQSLRHLPLPVICAVNGVAAGAGANIALACDIVLAGKSASFVEVFCKLGLIPDTGGTYFLPRLVGSARAMGLAMLGEKLTAEKAEDWGLIWKAFPTKILPPKCRRWRALGRRADQGPGLHQASLARQSAQQPAPAADAGMRHDERAGPQRRLPRRRGRLHGKARATVQGR
jgi:enoyl-CoA hydratase/carnithine racemase